MKFDFSSHFLLLRFCRLHNFCRKNWKQKCVTLIFNFDVKVFICGSYWNRNTDSYFVSLNRNSDLQLFLTVSNLKMQVNDFLLPPLDLFWKQVTWQFRILSMIWHFRLKSTFYNSIYHTVCNQVHRATHALTLNLQIKNRHH